MSVGELVKETEKVIVVMWLRRIFIFCIFQPFLFSHVFNKISIFSSCAFSGEISGPVAVAKSLERGFKSLGINFNINSSESEVGDVVLVLDDRNWYHRAIEWKKNRKIKFFLAGPNIGIHQSDLQSLLTCKELDAYLVPSQWPKDNWLAYNQNLESKIYVWPAGVDTNFWKPSNCNQEKSVLVYYKNGSPEFCLSVENILKKHNYKPLRIRYGAYTHGQLKLALEKSLFAIFLTQSESQGIALAQAWSMNVPTLVWNPQGEVEYLEIKYKNISSSPYLNCKTGKMWKSLKELENLIVHRENILLEFSPREWVLENMSDEKSCELLINILNELESR